MTTTPIRDNSLSEYLYLGIGAPLAGLLIGVVVGLFRRALDSASAIRAAAMEATSFGLAGTIGAVFLCGVSVILAAWIVRACCPEAAGSGIPRLQGVLADELPPAPPRMIAVKFIASILAIAPGLALGREGPSVQIGASMAYHAGRLCRAPQTLATTLLSAGGGAGLAAAFSAPLAGTLFVIEALMKRFEAKAVLAALGASVVAVWTVQLIVGAQAEFDIPTLPQSGLATACMFGLLGIVAGGAGLIYTWAVMTAIHLCARLRVPFLLRAGIIGVTIGAIAVAAPDLVGAGTELAQSAINGDTVLHLLPVLLLVRLGIIILSVVAGTPGGLLVPILALGADLGLLYALITAVVLPDIGLETSAFAIAGMAALFAAIIRTPLAAVVLVTEITGATTQVLPMAIACFIAVIVPAAAKQTPILEALRARRQD